MEVSSTYLGSPLFPLEIPKIRKSENDLITLSNRSPTTNNITSEENHNDEEHALNQLNIKYALSTMYKGYLTAIPSESTQDQIFSSIPSNDKKKEDMDQIQEKEHKNMKLNFVKIMQEKEKIQLKLDENEIMVIEELIKGFIDDSVIAIRNKVIEIICGLFHKMDKNRLNAMTKHIMSKWTQHKSYMYRLSSIHLFANICLIQNFSLTQEFFNLILKNGLKEKVSNVKLCLLRLIGLINQIHPNLTQKNQQLRILLGFMQGDINKNVSYIANMIQMTLEETLN